MKLGVIGVWFGENYGSVLTYWALQQTLRSLGHDICMIRKPWRNSSDPEVKGNHALEFADSHFPWISPSLHLAEFGSLNNALDGFVVGSDQVWNYGISKQFGHSFYLDFADTTKLKLSYASSFGHPVDFAPPEEQKLIARLLKRFDGISVREASGVNLAKKVYGADAVQVLDPVMLPSRTDYDDLMAESDWQPDGPYILSYVLDPTPEKVALLTEVSNRLKLPLVNVLDGRGNRAANREALGMPVLEDVNAIKFLQAFRNSSFVVTDSFHGTSFSILFSKPFITLPNRARGVTRFDSLLTLTGLRDRAVYNLQSEMDLDALVSDIDYQPVEDVLAREREKSLLWLTSALGHAPKQASVLPDPDLLPMPAVPLPYSSAFLVEAPKIARQLVKAHSGEKGWRPAKGVETAYVPATLSLNPLCNGCMACLNACPFDAVRVAQDDYGYYRPQIHATNCTDCGLCVRVCPAIVPPAKTNSGEPDCYSFQTTDQQLLQASTSGGVFTLLASHMIDQAGAVVGAVWDGVKVRHQTVEQVEDLPRLQKSKYLQSDVGNSFIDVRDRLKRGQPVLFSGLPCQVAGLLAFLKKPPKSLLTVDLLCGNAPSSAFFRSYVRETFGDIGAFQFRHKGSTFSGPHTVQATYPDGQKKVLSARQDAYQRMYHPHTLCPLHCENCQYQSLPRYGDITIGDFWGLSKRDLECETRNGMSLILTNNTNGAEFMKSALGDQIGLLTSRPLKWIGKNGFALPSAVPWAGPLRDAFYRAWRDTRVFTESIPAGDPTPTPPGSVSSNYPIQLSYRAQSGGFSFDPEHWLQSVTDQGTRLSPKPGFSRRGIQATMTLGSPLKEGRVHRLCVEFEILTETHVINFHVKNSRTGAFQVVLPCTIIPSQVQSLTVHGAFTPKAEGYDQFMIGAVHIRGNNAYVLVKSVIIETM